MPIPLYLAMTAAEFYRCDPLPGKIAWMACHFSPYGTGITNLPRSLPPGSILILNDRTPVYGHDPLRVAQELAATAAGLDCRGILLDLQRPEQREIPAIVQAICDAAPCPVAVSECYCQEADCAVFLTPPLHIPLAEFLAPWQGREVWLDAAVEWTDFVLTEGGCRQEHPGIMPTSLPHRDEDAFCQYAIGLEPTCARFSLHRDKSQLFALLAAAQGVSCAVGLFQQLK